jgi:hydroxymethylpyrimidine/phosphomethylpyrimidine kinase
MKRVLTIAGSDSGGGAGIQADLKTIQALGCYGASAITALTAQNTQGVRSVFAVEANFVADQIRAVLEDIGADAIKIGMLHRTPVIEAVAACLAQYRDIPVILDPVIAAQSGDRLLDIDAIEAMKSLLFPMAFLITPNLPEAKLLVYFVTTEQAASDLLKMGPRAVLIKGGHDQTRATADDYLLQGHDGKYLSAPWVTTQNTHGTGCTLSAAIASYVAHGSELDDAVAEAKKYLSGALRLSTVHKIGRGHGPVRHDWRWVT